MDYPRSTGPAAARHHHGRGSFLAQCSLVPPEQRRRVGVFRKMRNVVLINSSFVQTPDTPMG